MTVTLRCPCFAKGRPALLRWAVLLRYGKANTSFTYTENFRGKWVSQGGTPDLYMIYYYKITVGPVGDVKREIVFYEDGCR